MYYLILEVLLDVLYVLRGTLRGAISHPPPSPKNYIGGVYGGRGVGNAATLNFFIIFFTPHEIFPIRQLGPLYYH